MIQQEIDQNYLRYIELYHNNIQNKNDCFLEMPLPQINIFNEERDEPLAAPSTGHFQNELNKYRENYIYDIKEVSQE